MYVEKMYSNIERTIFHIMWKEGNITAEMKQG